MTTRALAMIAGLVLLALLAVGLAMRRKTPAAVGTPASSAKVEEAAAAAAAAAAAEKSGDSTAAMKASIAADVATHQSGGDPAAVAAARAASEAASRAAQAATVQKTATNYAGVVTNLDDVTVDGYAKLRGIPDHLIPGLAHGPPTTVEAARAACSADPGCVGYLVNRGNPGDAGLPTGGARLVLGPDAANDRWVQRIFDGIGIDFMRKRY